MNRLVLLVVFLIPVVGLAQVNLVANGSFEEKSACPSTTSQLYLTTGWLNPNTGSPDYLNECCLPYVVMNDTFYPVGVPENGWGYQNAKTGAAYGGFYAYQSSPHREYIEVHLSDKLIQNKKYVFSAYLSLADKTGLGTNLGAFFSVPEITSDSINLWEYFPQITTSFSVIDKDSWVLWQDTVTSINGNEEYLVIGNFNDVLNSDTIYSGTDSGGYRWASYYYIDDVSVVALDTTIGINEFEQVKFEIYPNPAKDIITIETAPIAIGITKEVTILQIVDITGRVVSSTSLSSSKTTIDVSAFSAGVYIAVLEQEGKVIARRKIVLE